MARDPAPSASSLEVIAKLAAARVVSARRLPDPHEHLAWVESGEPFEQAGVRGFLDGLPRRAGTVRTQTLRELLEALESGRSPDLGGGFMRSTPRARRHARGEYYTPAWLVERVLDRAGFDPRADERLVDPMCGAGAFLAAALARLRAARPGAPAEELAVLVRGMDVSPLAVLMARTACLVALAGAPRRGGAIRIGVDCRDAILDPGPDDPAEVVAGNPPWIGWESLPDAYRRATRHLWSRYGLFADRGGAGMQALLGRSKKDLAMLATYVAADRLLKPGGRLAFVLTRTVFKSVGSGAGFRRFELPGGAPLQVTSVDDYGHRAVFPGTGARAAVLSLRKGARTCYPVRFLVHGRAATDAAQEQMAEPVDPAEPTSAWLTGPAERLATLRRLTGPSGYRARAGAYTGGANGVYWLRVLEPRAEGLILVENLPGSGKRCVPPARAELEAGLVFPLLRSSDVGRFRARCHLGILVPQDPDRRRGIDETTMSSRYPRTLDWLRRFKRQLAARKDRGTRSLVEAGAPFYSMFSVSRETLAPWKVVWPRIARRVFAAAVGPMAAPGGGPVRPVVPQETCTLVACGSEAEAWYLAALLNSSLFNEAAMAFAQTGGKGFGAPHLLRHVRVPRFDPREASHRTLAGLARERAEGLSTADLDQAAGAIWAEVEKAGRPVAPGPPRGDEPIRLPIP